MSTRCACTMVSVAVSTSATTHSPRSMSHTTAEPPFAPASVPLMPRSTLTTARFIAWHMCRLRSQPDAPMSAPITVSSWLDNTKPSAHSAQPLNELRIVMTTGVSAEPMAQVMWAPRKSERPMVAPRARTPPSTVVAGMKANNAVTQPPSASRLIRFLAGRATLLLDTSPCSLPKAATLPVKVTAPMSVPAQMANLWPASAAGCAANEATLVSAAARPTSE
mmetsp:Transcript_8825/g.27384  ORF Transcript_8825/g.27384 Transcript_8825/m.27384 type:complete len:221 (-) Transcript_8825:679-1341(-)